MRPNAKGRAGTPGWRVVAALVLVLLLVGGASASAEVPAALTEPIVDRTGTLTAADIAALRARVDAIAARKGSQVAVLMVETTEPLSIEQYALAVAEATRLGRAGVDDGVLIVVAKRDRAVRIEVGRGLEGAIPDAIASRIIREYLGPRFRAGDFAGGLAEALDAIGRLIDGEPLPPPLDAHGRSRPGSAPVDGLDLYLGLFLGAFVAAFVTGLGLPRTLRPGVAGGIAAVVAGAVLKTLAAILGAAIAAVLLSLFGGGPGGVIGPRGSRRGGPWAGGGWGGGWSRGGWGGGWSGGGWGGWSGGGGTFGGGGASGRW
jgi:uncharacterized protein